MTHRENQLRLDRLALRYLAALEAEDFNTIADLWEQAVEDTDLGTMLHELNAELAAEQDQEENAAVASAVLELLEKHLPSAEIVRPESGPLTVADVAEQMRRHPPPGLSLDDMKLNDLLRQSAEEIPSQLALRQVLDWARQFGDAPEVYWKAFRHTAIELRMRRESNVEYRMAARPATRPPSEGKS